MFRVKCHPPLYERVVGYEGDDEEVTVAMDYRNDVCEILITSRGCESDNRLATFELRWVASEEMVVAPGSARWN